MASGMMGPSPVTILPTFKQGVQDNIVVLLEEQLERARRGELATVFVVAELVDERWNWQWSGAVITTRLVGRLEIAKHELIATLKDDPA